MAQDGADLQQGQAVAACEGDNGWSGVPRKAGSGGWLGGGFIIRLLSSTHPLVLPTGDRAMNKWPSFYLTPKADHGYHKTDAHGHADL